MKRSNLAIIVMALLALLILPIMSACPAPTPPAEAKVLKIGQIISMSGPFAPGLETVSQGVEVAAEWINEKGGITIDGQKYTIEIVLVDDKSSPEGAVAAANRLIYDENINFIVGPTIPWLAISMARVSEEAKVIRSLAVGTGTPDEMNADMRYTFTPFFPTTYFAPAYDYLTEAYPNARKIAIVSPEEPGGIYGMDLSKKLVQAKGLSVAFAENYPVETMDFFPICTRMLEANPDAIDLGMGVEPWYAGIIKAARQLGFTGPFFSGAPLVPNIITALAGEENTYDVFSICVNPESTEYPPLALEIKQRVEAKYGPTYQDRHIGGWSALWCLIHAIEAAQSLDTTEVAGTWEKMESIETVFGPATMGGQELFGINHVVMAPRPLIRVDYGVIKDIRMVTPRFAELEK